MDKARVGGRERTYAAPKILSALRSAPMRKTASATVPIHIGHAQRAAFQLTPPPAAILGCTAAYSPVSSHQQPAL